MSSPAANQAAYDAWIDAVSQALRSSGRGFGVTQIDPVAAQSAFSSGVSPVLFARTAHAVTAPVPDMAMISPNGTICRVSHLFLSVAGWICWLAALVGLLFAFLTLFARSENDLAASAKTWAIAIQLAWSFGAFVAGSLWHYLAQRLAIAYCEWLKP